MKHLIVFVDPAKKFNREHEELTKIQIDNCLNLGYVPEDVILATNFPYEYRGVEATLVSDDCYYSKNNYYRSSKIPVINELFQTGMIVPGELYWFRDNDAFQLEPINEDSLRKEIGNNVMAITDHGWHKRWNAGSFFFTSDSANLFLEIRRIMDEKDFDEQFALEWMINNGQAPGCVKLNITWNFSIYYHVHTFRRARKPLMVAHFHPHKPRHLNLYKPLVPDRFKEILSNYGLS